MKIYDISQELLTASVYEGDPAPAITLVSSMERGDLYNLSLLSMCAHNGTHVDAPRHFIAGGQDVSQIPLDYCVGCCFVAECSGVIAYADAERIVATARALNPDGAKRILIKGDAVVSEGAAEAFAASGVLLVGVESQSVGPLDAPMATHLILLRAGVVLLEGLRLSSVKAGGYLLSAAPISIAGADGAPTRAVLIEL